MKIALDYDGVEVLCYLELHNPCDAYASVEAES